MAVIECVGCSAKANDEWAVCPTCGANPKTGEQIVLDSIPPVDRAAVLAAPSFPFGAWALGLVLVVLAMTFIPVANSAYSVIGGLLWMASLILGIIGVVRPPRALAIIALVICVLPFVIGLVMDSLV